VPRPSYHRNRSLRRTYNRSGYLVRAEIGYPAHSLVTILTELSRVKNKTETNSVALVRKQNILTERQPLVVEVSANFCR
jgi:hypothetical protein